MKFHINSILPILLSVASTFIKVNAAPANTINQFTPGVKEFRMAIIGDSGAVEEAKEVMELSPFDIMLHVGDYDYEKNTEAYFEKILDADRKYKFVGVLGNHEEVYEVQQEKYERFVSNVYNEMVSKTKNNGVVCKFSPSRVMWACTYENMKMIGLTPNIDGADKPAEQLKFLKENLNQSTTEDWRACAWHYYDDNFHTGHYEDKHKDYVSGKVGESLYEYCKQHGAFIFSGHDHVYARSRVLSKFDGTVPTIDPSDSKTGPEIVQIRKGASINILNGAGGWSLYDERGKYKDFEWWQKTYALYESKKNGHNQGGLFCTFNVGGNSRKAYCEFQLIRLKDKVYDNFTIYRNDDPVNVPYTQIDENFKAILNGQVNDALPPQSNGNKGNVDNNNNNNKGTEGQEKGNNDNLVDTLFTKKNIIIGGSVCAAVAVIGGGILLFSKSNKKYTDDDHVNKEDEGYYNFKNNYNNNDNDNNDIRRYDFNNGDSDNRRYRDIMDNSNDSTYFKRSKSLLENSDFNPLPVPYEKNFYQDNNKFNKYKENGNNKYSDVTPLVSNQQKQRQGQKTYNLPYTTTSYYNNDEEDHEIEQNRQDNKRQYYRDRKNQESSLDQSSEELRYPYSQKSFKSEREPNYNTKFLNHRNSQELRYTKGSKDSNPNHQLNNKRSKEMKYYRDYYRDKQNMRDNNDTRDVRDDTRDIRDQRDPEAQYNYRNIRNNNYNNDDDDIENQRYASSSRNPRNQEPRLNNKSSRELRNKSSRELRNKSSRELRYQNKSSKSPGTQESQFKYRSERNQETDFNYRNERNQESEYNFRNRRNQESELNNYNNNNDYNNYNNNNNNNKVLRKAYSQRRYEEMKRTERGVPTMRLTKYNEEEDEEEEENPRNYNYFNQNKKYNYNTSNNNNFLFNSLSRNTTNESTPTKQQYSRYDKYQ